VLIEQCFTCINFIWLPGARRPHTLYMMDLILIYILFFVCYINFVFYFEKVYIYMCLCVLYFIDDIHVNITHN
jgi:hypothetical protein